MIDIDTKCNSRYSSAVSLLKTPLHAKHLELSARMLEFAGWEMPISYDSFSGGTKKEHQTVREEAGIFDVSHMGEFLFEGPGAAAFLDFACTRPMSSLKLGQARYALLLRQDGRILDDIIVYRLEDQRFMMVVNASNKTKDFKHLSEIRSNPDFELSDQSDRWALLAIQGPKSIELLDQLLILGARPDEIPYYSSETSKEGWIVARTGYTGEDGLEIFLPAPDAPKLWDQCLALGIKPIGLGARDTLRLEVGFPLYGHELSEELYPHETLASFAVSKKHSGFLGEDFRQKAPRFSPVAVCGDSAKPIREGDELHFEGKKIGWITSGSTSPLRKRGMGLGLIDREACSAGRLQEVEIFLESAGKQRKAQVTNLPFVETFRVKKKNRDKVQRL